MDTNLLFLTARSQIDHSLLANRIWAENKTKSDKAPPPPPTHTGRQTQIASKPRATQSFALNFHAPVCFNCFSVITQTIFDL